MTVGTRGGQKWFVTGVAALLIASQSLLYAVDSPAKHPTPRDAKDGYVGTVFSRLPDHTYSSWLVNMRDTGDMYGVSHIEDRGVEMFWLESSPRTSDERTQPLFRVVDVLVLPTSYKADGLVVTECRGNAQNRAVVALTEPDTRKEHRAWAIDLATATFIELSPAADTCSPLFIQGPGNN